MTRLAELLATRTRLTAARAEVTRLEADVDALVAELLDAPSSDHELHTMLGVPATALRLGVSRTAVRRLVSRGVLPSVRVGRRVLIRAATLETFLAQRERAGGEAI